MRLSLLLKLAAAAVLAVGIALIAVVKSIDFNSYKGFLAEQVRAATGREMTIAGPVQLKLGLVPSVVASGITLRNMAGGSRPDMATIERIEAEVALVPLLSRQIEIRRLVLVNPDLVLETDSKGRANWDFAGRTPDGAAIPADGSPPTRLDVRDVRIKNASITIRDGRDGSARQINVHKFLLTPQRGSSGIQFKAEYAGTMFELTGLVGATSALGAGKPWPVQLKGNIDGAVVTVDGTVIDPLAGRGLDLKLAAQGDELAHLLKVAGIAVPAVGPYKMAGRLTDKGGVVALGDIDFAIGTRDTALLSAKGAVKDVLALSGTELAVTVEADDLAGLSRLSGTALPSMGPLKLSGMLSAGKNGWKLADIRMGLGGSDLTGDLILTQGRRPLLAGTLASTTLSAGDFITPAAKPGEKLGPKPATAAADGRLFPDTKLPVEALRALDADVALRVGRLVVGGSEVSDLAATLRLKEGRLSLNPVTAGLGGGRIEADLSLDASKSPAVLALRLGAGKVELGKLLKDHVTGGLTEARVSLKGQGGTVRDLMAALSGDVLITTGEGRIANRAVDWAGGDLALQVLGSLNPLAATDEYTQLSCAVIHFVVRNGVAAADKGIAVETSKVNVVGAGTIDLRSEGIDIGIAPRARQGLGLSLGGAVAGLTRVRGTLANPAIGIDEIGTARTAASVGAAMATGGLSLLGEMLFDKVTADDHPCRTALGKPAKAKRGMVEGLFGR